MFFRITTTLKIVQKLVGAAFAAVLIASCTSGDGAEGAEASEGYESIQQAQRQELVCSCSRVPCEDRGSCVSVSCGTTVLNCCVYTPLKDGTSCTTPTNASGQCLKGQCCPCPVQDRLTGEITCQDCNDRNPCTVDGCARGVCGSTPVADGEACPSGVCIGGKCCAGCVDKEGNCRSSGSGDPEFCGLGGVACDICADDGNPCTDDVCTAGGCEHPARQNGVSCDDGNVCNGQSTCQGGRCVAGTPLSCPTGNPCVSYTCDPGRGCVPTNTTELCNDGNPCTVGDRCANGTCRPGDPATCDDNQFCTDDSCDPQQGGCINTPKAEDTECDDRNDCTNASVCNALGRCVGTSGRLCDDGDPCTIDGCSANVCNYATLEQPGTPCIPSNNKCLLNAMCDAAGACAGGEEKDCNDGNPCTSDSCDPTTGECVREPLDEGECNDDSACTVNDVCSDGNCVGEPVECAAFDDCHAPGTCDPQTGLCDDPRQPEGTECESGTGTCDRRGVCVPNPIGGAGGAPSDGGAPSEAGAPGEAGATAAGGTSGGAPSSGGGTNPQGEAGEDDEPGRGRPFVRDPGGCSCAVPADSKGNPASLLLLAGALGLGLARRRSRARAAQP